MRGGLGLIRPSSLCSPCSRLGHHRIRLRTRSSKRNGARMRGKTRARIRCVLKFNCFTGTKVQILTQLREQGNEESLTRNGGSTDAYLWYCTLMPEIFSTLMPEIVEL